MKNTYLEETKVLQLQFEKRGGLLPVVVQDVSSKAVLMLGYANQEAIKQSFTSGYATFWSTSRKALWTKGATSGDRLKIAEIQVDCDQDAVLYLVHMEGKGACHTQNPQGITRFSCFYRKIEDISDETLGFFTQ
ncbi:MAG: phosphoribosyl-AMP cyclohydrolase [Bacteroidota bacterium]